MPRAPDSPAPFLLKAAWSFGSMVLGGSRANGRGGSSWLPNEHRTHPRGLGDRRVSLCATQRGSNGPRCDRREQRARHLQSQSAWRKSGQSNKPTSRPSTTLRCQPRPPPTGQHQTETQPRGHGVGATPVGLPGTPVRATVRYTWRVCWCMVWCLRYSVMPQYGYATDVFPAPTRMVVVEMSTGA